MEAGSSRRARLSAGKASLEVFREKKNAANASTSGVFKPSASMPVRAFASDAVKDGANSTSPGSLSAQRGVENALFEKLSPVSPAKTAEELRARFSRSVGPSVRTPGSAESGKRSKRVTFDPTDDAPAPSAAHEVMHASRVSSFFVSPQGEAAARSSAGRTVAGIDYVPPTPDLDTIRTPLTMLLRAAASQPAPREPVPQVNGTAPSSPEALAYAKQLEHMAASFQAAAASSASAPAPNSVSAAPASPDTDSVLLLSPVTPTTAPRRVMSATETALEEVNRLRERALTLQLRHAPEGEVVNAFAAYSDRMYTMLHRQLGSSQVGKVPDEFASAELIAADARIRETKRLLRTTMQSAEQQDPAYVAELVALQQRLRDATVEQEAAKAELERVKAESDLSTEQVKHLQKALAERMEEIARLRAGINGGGSTRAGDLEVALAESNAALRKQADAVAAQRAIAEASKREITTLLQRVVETRSQLEAAMEEATAAREAARRAETAKDAATLDIQQLRERVAHLEHQVDVVRREAAAAASSLREQLREVTSSRDTLQQLVDEASAAMTDMQASHSSALAAAQRQHEQIVANLQQAHAREQDELRRQLRDAMVRANDAEAATRAAANNDAHASAVAHLQAKVQETMELLLAARNELSMQLERADNTATTLHETQHQLDATRARISELEAAAQSAQLAHTGCEAELERLREQLAQNNSSQLLVDSLSQQLRSEQDAHADAHRRAAAAETRADVMASSLMELQTYCENLRTQLSAERARGLQLEADRDRAEASVRTAESQRQEAVKTATDNLAGLEARIAELSTELDNARQAAAASSEARQAAEAELLSVQSSFVARSQAADDLLRSARSELQTCLAKIEALQADVNERAAACEEAGAVALKLEAELLATRNQLEELRTMPQQLAAINIHLEECRATALRDQLSAAVQQAAMLAQHREQVHQLRESHAADIATLEAQLQALTSAPPQTQPLVHEELQYAQLASPLPASSNSSVMHATFMAVADDSAAPSTVARIHEPDPRVPSGHATANQTPSSDFASSAHALFSLALSKAALAASHASTLPGATKARSASFEASKPVTNAGLEHAPRFLGLDDDKPVSSPGSADMTADVSVVAPISSVALSQPVHHDASADFVAPLFHSPLKLMPHQQGRINVHASAASLDAAPTIADVATSRGRQPAPSASCTVDSKRVVRSMRIAGDGGIELTFGSSSPAKTVSAPEPAIESSDASDAALVLHHLVSGAAEHASVARIADEDASISGSSKSSLNYSALAAAARCRHASRSASASRPANVPVVGHARSAAQPAVPASNFSPATMLPAKTSSEIDTRKLQRILRSIQQELRQDAVSDVHVAVPVPGALQHDSARTMTSASMASAAALPRLHPASTAPGASASRPLPVAHMDIPVPPPALRATPHGPATKPPRPGRSLVALAEESSPVASSTTLLDGAPQHAHACAHTRVCVSEHEDRACTPVDTLAASSSIAWADLLLASAATTTRVLSRI